MQKTCTIPDTFLILFNGQKLNFIFPLHPVCMNKIMKNKLSETSYQPRFGLQSIFRKISFLVLEKFSHLGNFDDLIHSDF